MEDLLQGGQLKSVVERIERLEEEKNTIGEDIKEVYHEARANGYDVKVLRKAIALRKRDINERREEEAILDLYLQAIGEQKDEAPTRKPKPRVGMSAKPSRVEKAAAALAQTLEKHGGSMEVIAGEGSVFAAAGEAVKAAGADVKVTVVKRSKERLSEAMADNVEFSKQMLEDGLISLEAHAENIALSDAVAVKLGAGVKRPAEPDDPFGEGLAG